MHILAVKQEDVGKVILALAGMTAEEYKAKRQAYIEQRDKEKNEREKEYGAMKERLEQKTAALEKELKEVYSPQIEGLKECNDIKAGILVRVWKSDACFVFYRYDGPGAFGRVKWSYATSKELNIPETWKEKRQEFYKDVIMKGCRLFQEYPSRRKVTPEIPKYPTEEKKVLMTINY